MTRRLTGLLVLLSISGSCKTTPEPKPEPIVAVAPKAEPVDAGVEPLIELAAAPPLPAVPAGLTAVEGPADNPVTAEKAELGQHLFWEKRLSKDNTMACESCHHPDKAFTSGNALDAKVGGAMNKRNAPSMLNLGAHTSYYWEGRSPTLEAVSLAAWKGQLGAEPADIVAQLNKSPTYRAEFSRAFGTDGATVENVPKALATFFRVLQNGNSPFDKFIAGDTKALSAPAKKGWELFQKHQCVACHTPPMFSDFGFHNVGIGDDAGRKDATKADADLGKFKTPSLRNVALTGPYFHDGKTATLEDAIALMAKGGNANPNLDPALKNQKLAAKDLSAIKAFLESLSGTSTYPEAPFLPAGPWTTTYKP